MNANHSTPREYPPKRNREFFRGCLLGGAIGDALGLPIEFKSFDEIVQQYGEHGIHELELQSDNMAEISDDTQMTLFTAEGILRAMARLACKGTTSVVDSTYYAYMRWLHTQGYPRIEALNWIYDGYLLEQERLHCRRAPGRACTSALNSGKVGSIKKPINNSKGCGGVMRMAPAGLYFDQVEALTVGMDLAALTHGHPTGYTAAGAFAVIIAAIIEGESIDQAVLSALEKLNCINDSEDTFRTLSLAIELADDPMPDLNAIKRIGEGWVAEEALAIGVLCSLRHRDDYLKGIIAAVNHDGDSDSTGAIAGNILGAYMGNGAIPQDWQNRLELRDVIEQLADSLLLDSFEDESVWEKWPGH
jgi:ADP-ribosylglycohydrolase